jgi:hypothetical protein
MSFAYRALDSGGRNVHIPFRASKLTQVLKDSFVNSKARYHYFYTSILTLKILGNQ